MAFIHKRHYQTNLRQTVLRLWQQGGMKAYFLATDLMAIRNATFVVNLTVVYPKTYEWLSQTLHLPDSVKEIAVVTSSILASASVATLLTNPIDNAITRRQSTFHPFHAKSSWEALKQPHLQYGWRGPFVALIPRLIAMAVIEQPLIHHLYHYYEPKVRQWIKE